MHVPLEHSSNLRVTVAIISNFGPTLKTASETEGEYGFFSSSFNMLATLCKSNFLPTALEIDLTNFCGVFPRIFSASLTKLDAVVESLFNNLA